MKWEDLRADQFPEAIEKSKGLCILPMGALEKHGEHLPVGVDSLKAASLSVAAAEIEDAVVFPTGLWVGDMIGMRSFTGDILKSHATYGCIAMNPDTLMAVMKELCDEIHRNGFDKILIVRGHGGNSSVIEYFLKAQMMEYKGYATMATTCYKIDDNRLPLLYDYAVANREKFNLTDEELKTLENLKNTGYGGGHAHFSETAFQMADDPDTVDLKKSETVSGKSSGVADFLGEIGVSHGAEFSSNYPEFYCGYPSTGCTQNIGLVFKAFAAEELAHIYKVLKDNGDKIQKMSSREILLEV